jgi:hypothetical protein
MIWLLPACVQAPHVYHLKPRQRRPRVLPPGGVRLAVPEVGPSGSGCATPVACELRRPHDIAVHDHLRLDELEDYLLAGLAGQTAEVFVPVHMPVVHRFSPGLYTREIFMPGEQPGRSGTVLTSRIHETTHQYVVLTGVALVTIPGQEPVRLEAGHVGFTEAGTRRGLYIVEDCRWLTMHVLSPKEEEMRHNGTSEKELVEMVERRILGVRDRGRDVFAEYKAALAAASLPGPHDGPRSLGGAD